MKRTLVLIATVALGLSTFAQSNVYFTSEITPQSLVSIYHALGVNPTGNVALKISTVDAATGIEDFNPQNPAPESLRYNVFTIDGKKVLSNARSIDSLPAGVYIVNGKKMVITKKQ